MGEWRGTAALVVVAAVVLAGCGDLGRAAGRIVNGDSSGLQGSSCTGLTGAACTQQADKVASRHPGALQVDLTCAVPKCSRASGAGTAVVTLADGSKVNDTFAYVGDPAPMPSPVCTGLAPDRCADLAQSQFDELPLDARVMRIQVTCTAAACTDAGGEATVKLTMADGSVQEGGASWSS
jgi:hypothetical protein